jgi:Xaa-Pro aminopeptidase
VPFVRADRVRTEEYDMTMVPGMTYNIEITPVDKEGIYGIFYSRSFAITEKGYQDLTPYDVDEILVAG